MSEIRQPTDGRVAALLAAQAGVDTATGQAQALVATRPGPPLCLLAEVTYRCPLHCVLCCNPTDFAAHEQELDTASWLRVLREGRQLGAVQCGFSGGEPLVRDDLDTIIALADDLGPQTSNSQTRSPTAGRW